MDYYDLLGVKRSASADELKTAYKRQAMKNHPDKGGDPEKFKQINEAYQALSDPQQKQMYDQFGTTDPQQAHMNSGGFHFTTGPGGAGFDDILRHFGFGQQFGHGFANQRSRKNKDIRLNWTIKFEDQYTGKTDTLSYKLLNGKVEVLDVKIPPGIREGDNIKFQGYGDNSIPNLPRGDLIIRIHIQQHPKFRREGNDIYTIQEISAFDLITGIKKDIVSPEDKKITLTIPPGTGPNTIFSISDHGVPDMNTKRKGNLFVEVKCIIPKLSKEQISKLKKSIDDHKIFC